MINYKFNKKTGFVETTLEGKISVKDITDYIISLSKDKKLPKKLKIISDAVNAEFANDATPEDLYKIVEANKISLSVRDYICDAFIISSPIETAMGQLYAEFSKAENYFFNIFSTKKAATDWLNNIK